jgi:RNA ligase (TIGR02306 family)
MAASTHRVEVIRIGEIEKHPNADSLGIVRIYGYTCCVRLGDFQPGDLAAYIVPDSVVPDTPAFAFLQGHRRIKVRRLRGMYSQGLLVKAPEGACEGDDVAEVLGVTRYEPPCAVRTGGSAEPGPGFFCPKYDVESWHRYKALLVEGEEIAVTEKIHGASARFTWANERLYCGSRSEWLREASEVLWWVAAAASPWIEEFARAHAGWVLYGEVFGRVQDLRYGVQPGGKPRFLAFDIFDAAAGVWVPWTTLAQTLPPEHRAPVLHVGPYAEARAVELSRGKSLVPGADHIREGVVLQPLRERIDGEIGRVKLKVVSDEYLERS